MNSKYNEKCLKTRIYKDDSCYRADGLFAKFPRKISERTTEEDDIYDDFTLVDSLDLSTRTKRGLIRACIETLSDLKNCTCEEILSKTKLGLMGLRDIEGVVELRKTKTAYYPSRYGIK